MELIRRNGDLFPSLMNSFFGTDFFGRPDAMDFDYNLGGFGFQNLPSVNITENEKAFFIEMAAPGLEKKDFKIEAENDMLTISCEKKDEKKMDEKNFRRREFSYQAFTRSFHLPENSLPDKLEAKYDNGILKLNLPKKEVTFTKPKKEITVA